MMKKLQQSPKAKAGTESWWSSLARSLEKIAFFLLVLLLPTQFGKHFWPSFSFVLGSRIDYLSPTLYVTDILIGILFIFSLVRKRIRFHPLFLCTVLFISVSIFLSQTPSSGWYFLAKFLEISFLIWYVTRSPFIMYHSSFIILSLGIVFESLLALAQFLSQHSLGGIFYFLGERDFSSSTPGIANASINGELILRPYATFSHPNVLAGYMGVGMLLVLFFWNMQRKTVFQRFFLWTTLFIGTLGLFLSLGRVAIVAWLASLVMLIVYHRQRQLKHSLLIMLSCFLACLLLLVLFFPQLITRFAFSVGDESFLVRQQLAQSALRMIIAHPLFGVGPNNFIPQLGSSFGTPNGVTLDAHGAIQPWSFFQQNSFVVLQPVHNIFLLIAAELGIPGALLFVGFFLYLAKNLWRLWDTSTRSTKRQILPLILALFVIFLTGMFDHYWLTLQQEAR